MNRKDYRAISDVMSTLRNDSIFRPVVEGCDPVPPTAYVAHVAFALCDVFAADNPRFDREQFLAACALGRGKDND
jgi:hypothetical protein